MKQYLSPVLLILCLLHGTTYGQQQKKSNPYADDFVRGENLVFYDDFAGDKMGVRPQKWQILDDEATSDWFVPTEAYVGMLDSLKCLYFKQGNGGYAMPYWHPSAYADNYKDYYWTIEFDFRFVVVKNNSENNVYIDYSTEDYKLTTHIDFDRHWVQKSEEGFQMGFFDSSWIGHNAKYPLAFNKTAWHHFAFSISGKFFQGYIDHFKLLSVVPSSSCYIPGLMLGGRGTMGIRNFRIAYTDPAHPMGTTAAALLTEKKFVTHAITFDKNKAVIRQESMPFLQELAAFLKANASIKLEIGGHTDNDGTPAANLVLSNERAAAIKKQLVSMGVAGERLKTKGFGASQPIDDNMREDGKAMNRRVEFVRL